jgi:hypothetical protein
MGGEQLSTLSNRDSTNRRASLEGGRRGSTCDYHPDGVEPCRMKVFGRPKPAFSFWRGEGVGRLCPDAAPSRAASAPFSGCPGTRWRPPLGDGAARSV